MAKKRKLTALQKRIRKEKERKERAAYEARKAKSVNVPRGTMRNESQKKAIRDARKRTAADTAKLNRAQLTAEVSALWDAAYKKYRRLMQQGTPTAATVIYEQNFAGMNPARMNMNTLRAQSVKLKNWLKRKDVSATKSKKAQKSTLKYLRSHGFPQISADDLTKFFDLYQKYLEYTGGVPQGVKKYLEHFATAYEKYKENPEENMQRIFDNARERMYVEYESTFNAAAFAENPLDL